MVAEGKLEQGIKVCRRACFSRCPCPLPVLLQVLLLATTAHEDARLPHEGFSWEAWNGKAPRREDGDETGCLKSSKTATYGVTLSS